MKRVFFLIAILLLCVVGWAQADAPDPLPVETPPTESPAEPAAAPIAEQPLDTPVVAQPAETLPVAAPETAPADAPAAESGHGGGHHGVPGDELSLLWVIPFAGILLSIALFPLFAPHFWHEHFPKIAAFWALAFSVPFLVLFKGPAIYSLLHIYLVDYIPFIILLWGLYTAAGAMIVRGTLRGSPAVNLLLLLIGTLLASWIGTTGASMLLIRPVLRANAWRKNKTHVVVFFIFLVSNIGGSLTPLGDPPLFLGFIHGVSFFWTLHLLPQMFFVVSLLLALFFAMDSYYFRQEGPAPDDGVAEPVKLDGLHNILFFGGIMGAVLFSGMAKLGHLTVGGVHVEYQNLIRDGVIVLMGVLSIMSTKKQLRDDNEFTWFPIKEVAYLFAGIFATIVPALAILKAGAHGPAAPLISAVEKPWHFFWVTGTLSSFLDNAPTYLTFFTTAIGKLYPSGIVEKTAAQLLMGREDQLAAFFQQVQGDPAMKGYIAETAKSHGVAAGAMTAEMFSGFKYLLAISVGAVFMGANTYIGNAPNFMVKSIAEEAGVTMPSFFGYMLKYSLPILVTSFVVVTFAFYAGDGAINLALRYGVPAVSITYIVFMLLFQRGGRR
ncbi:MAG: sodium:proton antiporter [Candidatus Lernaella stagnicola]|nr:sodium:proton antiporter [Candidatus Lernaella stagnicola]